MDFILLFWFNYYIPWGQMRESQGEIQKSELGAWTVPQQSRTQENYRFDPASWVQPQSDRNKWQEIINWNGDDMQPAHFSSKFWSSEVWNIWMKNVLFYYNSFFFTETKQNPFLYVLSNTL